MVPGMVEPAIDTLRRYGLRVIIAHPERNLYLQHVRSYCDRLVDSGCFLQLTAGALAGAFGPAASSTASYILRRHLAHFVASDAHGAATRRPGLDTAFAAIAKRYGELAAQRLMLVNPKAALAGFPIRPMLAATDRITSLVSQAMRLCCGESNLVADAPGESQFR